MLKTSMRTKNLAITEYQLKGLSRIWSALDETHSLRMFLRDWYAAELGRQHGDIKKETFDLTRMVGSEKQVVTTFSCREADTSYYRAFIGVQSSC